ncbi:MAG: YceI family protein, partial [Bradymonadaceae bacterium]
MARTQWDIDPVHSTINFKVRHMMFSKVNGRFKAWDGHFEFDPENPQDAHVKVEIDASSIDTGVEDRDNHLRSGDFFNAEEHPRLVFESRSFEHAGESLFRIHGDLKIRNESNPVTIDVHYHGQGKDPWGNTRVGFSGTTELNRKDFG